jgi:hypothetical protein
LAKTAYRILEEMIVGLNLPSGSKFLAISQPFDPDLLHQRREGPFNRAHPTRVRSTAREQVRQSPDNESHALPAVRFGRACFLLMDFLVLAHQSRLGVVFLANSAIVTLG